MAYKGLNKIVCGKYNVAIVACNRPFSGCNAVKPCLAEAPAQHQLKCSRTQDRTKGHQNVHDYSTCSRALRDVENPPRAASYELSNIKTRRNNAVRGREEVLKSKIPILHRAIDDIILNYNSVASSKENNRKYKNGVGLKYQTVMDRLPQVRVSAKGTRHQFVPADKSSSVLGMIKKDLLTINTSNTATKLARRPSCITVKSSVKSSNHSKSKDRENQQQPKVFVKGCEYDDLNDGFTSRDKAKHFAYSEVKRKIAIGSCSSKLDKPAPSMYRLKRDGIRPDINEMHIRHQIKYTRPVVAKRVR